MLLINLLLISVADVNLNFDIFLHLSTKSLLSSNSNVFLSKKNSLATKTANSLKGPLAASIKSF